MMYILVKFYVIVADGVTMVRAQELDLANWEEPLVLWSRSDLAIGNLNGWLQTPVRPPKAKVGILLLALVCIGLEPYAAIMLFGPHLSVGVAWTYELFKVYGWIPGQKYPKTD